MSEHQRQRSLSTAGESLYHVLGVEKVATTDDIKRSYRWGVPAWPSWVRCRKMSCDWVVVLFILQETGVEVPPWQESRQSRGSGQVQGDQQRSRHLEWPHQTEHLRQIRLSGAVRGRAVRRRERQHLLRPVQLVGEGKRASLFLGLLQGRGGGERVGFFSVLMRASPLLQALFVVCGLATGCYFCCCLCCCCNCCCGRCKPRPRDAQDQDFYVSPEDLEAQLQSDERGERSRASPRAHSQNTDAPSLIAPANADASVLWTLCVTLSEAGGEPIMMQPSATETTQLTSDGHYSYHTDTGFN